MNITLNIPIKILERLVSAIEQLAHDYATVHRAELDRYTNLDVTGGRTYYQSDAAIVAEEQKQRAQREAMEDL